MARAKYCKNKNTYSIEEDCEQPYYWNQGIGSLVNQSNRAKIFDATFDATFN